MLYYRRPIVTQLADKYEVRRYVAERIGPRFLNELYGVWEKVGRIDRTSLPDGVRPQGDVGMEHEHPLREQGRARLG
jgi:hypothetical protein